MRVYEHEIAAYRMLAGNVYLIDFDAAMQLSPEKQSDTRLLGTVIYAAPEQFGLTRSDVRTISSQSGFLSTSY